MFDDLFKKAYSLVNLEEEEKKKEWYEELEEQVCSFCPTLSFQHRVFGCFIFLLLGFLISMGSTLRLIQLLKGNPRPFAIMYTIGNVLGICSTCFLYGPWAQFKKMFAFTRLVTTAIYFFFMAVTLFIAFYPKEIPLRGLWLVFSIFFQFMALIWYSLSYIPYAREIVFNIFKSCCRGYFTTQPESFWEVEL